MRFLRRTWLPTILSVLLSTSIWWWIGDWSVARGQILQTLLLTPLIWWFVVGRKARPRVWRGLAGGGLAGLVTQSAPNFPDIWHLYQHRAQISGEDQMIAMASVVAFLIISSWAISLGALVGLIAVLVQRRIDGPPPASELMHRSGPTT